LRRAIALKPDYAEAHNNLGNLLQDQGKLDDAIASFHTALASPFASVAEIFGVTSPALALQLTSTRRTGRPPASTRRATSGRSRASPGGALWPSPLTRRSDAGRPAAVGASVPHAATVMRSEMVRTNRIPLGSTNVRSTRQACRDTLVSTRTSQ